VLRVLLTDAGNPLFGWWELGAAIVGDTPGGHVTAADISPCTTKVNEANEMTPVLHIATT